jgi:hypothetical protein
LDRGTSGSIIPCFILLWSSSKLKTPNVIAWYNWLNYYQRKIYETWYIFFLEVIDEATWLVTFRVTSHNFLHPTYPRERMPNYLKPTIKQPGIITCIYSLWKSTLHGLLWSTTYYFRGQKPSSSPSTLTMASGIVNSLRWFVHSI